MISEKHYIDLYKKQKEKELGWGESTGWTSQDFEKLSEMIFQKTSVRLSESTLKRVWGKVKYDSAPTVTTLNALAQFSGFENWRSFKLANDETKEKQNGHSTRDRELSAPISLKKKKNILIVMGTVCCAFLITALTIFKHDSTDTHSTIDSAQIKFDFKIVSNELPNSVVFDYTIGNNEVDTLKLQQSWDPQRQEVISPLKNQHTSIYYYPGFFVAKLIADDVILKERDIFIKTDGWKGIIEQLPVPAYLSRIETGQHQDRMTISRDILSAKTGKTVFNNIWTSFYKVEDFGNISSTDFRFDATIQNTSTKEEAVCQQVKVKILTTRGAIEIPLSSKGCISAISIFTGERLISGKDMDLSAFGCDFSVPQKLSCSVSDQKLTIQLNQKEIFTSTHTTDLGKVIGLILGFEGTGWASGVNLRQASISIP